MGPAPSVSFAAPEALSHLIAPHLRLVDLAAQPLNHLAAPAHPPPSPGPGYREPPPPTVSRHCAFSMKPSTMAAWVALRSMTFRFRHTCAVCVRSKLLRNRYRCGAQERGRGSTGIRQVPGQAGTGTCKHASTCAHRVRHGGGVCSEAAGNLAGASDVKEPDLKLQWQGVHRTSDTMGKRDVGPTNHALAGHE